MKRTLNPLKHLERPKKDRTSKDQDSWEQVGSWYDTIVGSKGHYYHQHVIIPKLIPLLKLKENNDEALLDLACGQGVLSRHLPPGLPYTGVDNSPKLIKAAKALHNAEKHGERNFILGDITKPLKLPRSNYSHVTMILAVQNIDKGEMAIKHASEHLKPGGTLVMVLNHPCFRIPRQSAWGIDEATKTRYRRIDRYQSVLKIPIQTHPSKGKHSTETYSYHHPLSHYCQWLYNNGLFITALEEWCSDKISKGKKAIMENRSRQEIPLFLAISSQKLFSS